MSNRRRKQQFLSDKYWQSAAFNQIAYNSFLNQIITIACNRFRWINLPETCDARFIERTLLFDGVITFATPKQSELTGAIFSTKALLDGNLNVYDNPITWKSIGNNGWNFTCDSTNAVLCFDNSERAPIMPMITLLARELADILRTKQINRMHQKMPYIITGPEEKKQEMMNLFKMIAGNEPAVIATSGIQAIDVKVLNTNVDYLATMFENDLQETWAIVYALLGIENIEVKKERQIYGELNAQKTPDDIQKMSYLSCRRDAARQMNELFGTNVQVVDMRDYESDNYNFTRNIEQQKEAGEGTTDDNNSNGGYDGNEGKGDK